MVNNKILIKKNLALGIVTILGAAAFGWLFRHFTVHPSLNSLIYAVIGGVIFLALFLIQSLLTKNFWLNAAIVVVETLALSVFFFGGAFLLTAVGTAVMLVLLILAYHNGQEEIKNNLEIHFLKISRVVMGLATMALAIFASLAYVGSFDLKNQAAAKKNLEVLVKPLEPVIAGYIPGFSSQNTLPQIAAKILPADFKLAPEPQKSEAITQISARLADTFGNFLGVRAAAGDRVIDILYKASIGRLAGLSPLLQNLILIGIAIIFFFFIKFALFFADWLALLFGYGLYKLLLFAGFFRIELQNVPKRSIILE